MNPATAERLKRRAAEYAVERVRSGMVLGLGTGSTVAHFLDLLADRLTSGDLRGIAGVPTSAWTEAEAKRLGIPLTALAEHGTLDLTVDGADEVDPRLDLVKGMGGALLREKMVAQASTAMLVIADEAKAVARLGTRSPLPVEVVSWGWEAQARFLSASGAEVSLRTDGGAPYVSDNGNYILHCRFPDGIEDAHALDDALRARAGVVETGLFLGLASEVVIAHADGVRVLGRDS